MKERGILDRDADGEVLILDTESDRIHQLNGTASLIWRQLEQGATVEEIARALEFQIDVDSHTSVRHVRRFLIELQDLDILQRSVRD
jgi:hypothetical protein